MYLKKFMSNKGEICIQIQTPERNASKAIESQSHKYL